MGTETSFRAEQGPAEAAGAAPGWWEMIPRRPLAARAKVDVRKRPKRG